MRNLFKGWLWTLVSSTSSAAVTTVPPRFGNASKQKSYRLSFTVKNQSKGSSTTRRKMRKTLNRRPVSEYLQIRAFPPSSGDPTSHQMENFSSSLQGFGKKRQKADLSTAPSSTAGTSWKNPPSFCPLMESLPWSANFVPNCSEKKMKSQVCSHSHTI